MEKCIDNAVIISSKLNKIRASSDFHNKEKFQKFVFPEGISYNFEKHEVRILKTNLLFAAIASLQSIYTLNKKGRITKKSDLSFCVGTTGFEPATTRPPDVDSTGLNYVPKWPTKVILSVNFLLA